MAFVYNAGDQYVLSRASDHRSHIQYVLGRLIIGRTSVAPGPCLVSEPVRTVGPAVGPSPIPTSRPLDLAFAPWLSSGTRFEEELDGVCEF